MQENVPLAITAKQLCQLLSISKTTLWRLCKTKAISPLKIYRRSRVFAYADVLALLKNK
jgi:predicted DNA-binding transcriptional regulator AlpA